MTYLWIGLGVLVVLGVIAWNIPGVKQEFQKSYQKSYDESYEKTYNAIAGEKPDHQKDK